MEEVYGGYLWTMGGVELEGGRLEEVRGRVVSGSGWDGGRVSYRFYEGEGSGDGTRDENLFARLVRGEIPQWRVWEDDGYVAFLTPFPNSLGYTVVVPRRHWSSDILGLGRDEFDGLMGAVRSVVEGLQRGLGTERVGMFFSTLR